MKIWTYLFFSFLAVILSEIIPAEIGFAQGVWFQDSSGGYKKEAFIARAGEVALIANDKIFVVGCDSLQIFDPVDHSWSTPLSGNTYIPWYVPGGYEQEGLRTGTACEVGGKIYVFGGYTFNSSTGGLESESLHVLDIASLTWSEPQTLGHFTPRENLMGCVVDGKIYAIGGNADTAYTGGPVFNLVEVFDPTTNTWSSPEMNSSMVPGEGRTAIVVNGKIYVIGGIDYDTNVLPTPPNQVLDPTTNTWSTISSHGMFLRKDPSTCVLNGKIYLIGGQIWEDSGLNFNDTGLHGYRSDLTQPNIQIYDPSSDTWSTPLTTGIFNGIFQAACAVDNGKIYVLGGNNGDISNYVQVFDPNAILIVNSENVSSKVYLSPNPTAGLVTIRCAAGVVSLEDALGREVKTNALPPTNEEGITLDLRNEPAGVYFVRIQTATGPVLEKIIRE